MNKDIQGLVAFLKENFFLIIVLVFIISPVVWQLSSMYYSGRIEQYELQIETLKSENESLERKNQGFKEVILTTEESVNNWSNIVSQ